MSTNWILFSHKARLVAGGHLINALDCDICSSTIKGLSIRLLHVITHKAGLQQICGYVGNAYVNAYTNKKVFARAGPKFGQLEGSIVIIAKALYSLKTSSERWHVHFSNSLRGLRFEPTRFDHNVWIRKNTNQGETDSYQYICSYVDNFMIVAKDPIKIMCKIHGIYMVKSICPPQYYLGNNYKKDKHGRWCIGCKKYINEAITRVKSIFGALKKFDNPSETGNHPELDNLAALDDTEHQKYQALIGMLVWIVTIGHLDIAHAMASLSRFTAHPHQGHVKHLL